MEKEKRRKKKNHVSRIIHVRMGNLDAFCLLRMNRFSSFRCRSFPLFCREMEKGKKTVNLCIVCGAYHLLRGDDNVTKRFDFPPAMHNMKNGV